MASKIAWMLMQKLGFNTCVASHELKMRMRGLRPFLLMLAYALLGSAAVILTFVAMTAWSSDYDLSTNESAEVGRTSFTVLSYTQLSLIVLLLPALSAGAITMEREKRTMDMLRATLLSAFDVVTGKMLVVLAFVVLLLVSTLPVASWSVLLGGVQPAEVVYVYTYLFAVAMMIVALGFVFSVVLRRSLGAIVTSYVTILVVLGGLPLMGYMYVMTSYMRSYGGSSRSTLSPMAAALIVDFVAVVVGWLVFVIARWLLGRLWRGFRGAWGWGGAAVVAALACAGCASYLSALAMPLLTSLELAAPIILHPFVTVAGLLFADMGRDMLVTPHGGAPTLSVDPQLLIWAVSTAGACFLAIALWALAVKLHHSRQ